MSVCGHIHSSKTINHTKYCIISCIHTKCVYFVCVRLTEVLRERDREQLYIHAHTYTRPSIQKVKWNKVLMIFFLFVVTRVLYVHTMTIILFANQMYHHHSFMYEMSNLSLLFWINSLKPNTKSEMQMQQNILNFEQKLHKSIHFNRTNGNEFDVMTINLLLNDFCTLELTLFVKKYTLFRT